jgi:hypothetical protein
LPCIDFVAEAERCPRCGDSLEVQKSRRRTVVTLDQGMFDAREISKRCAKRCCPPLRSEALRRLVKPGQRYSYDLLVHVGLGRYLEGQQREEIRQRLSAEHGIELSAGTISTLCDRFLSLLEALHVQRAPQLRAAQPGGYPLHIDATCEHGKGGLFVCMDGWRGWVLCAARIPTENGIYLSPVVQRTVELFGQPAAVVRDMGQGGSAAVEDLRKAGVPDLMCHYHFVAAVGTNLFDKLYTCLRNIIRQSRIRSDLFALLRELRAYDADGQREGRYGPGHIREGLKALILWVLEGEGRKDPPYPFALPHFEFVHRCRQSRERVEQWVPCPRTQPERRALDLLLRRVGRLERDTRLVATVESLNERWQTFSELRDVLRLSNAELPRADTRFAPPHLPAVELLRLEQIKHAVEKLEANLRERIPPAERDKARPTSAAGVVLKYLKANRVHLFGHPARFDSDGGLVAVVERTNNILEHFFGQEKQRLRRRVGRAHLGQDLEQQPAQAVLVANLRHADYVQALCGSLDNLTAAMAELDMQPHVVLNQPERQQRDKGLQQHVRELLDATASTSPPRVEQVEACHPPGLESQDFVSRCHELESLSDDELRVRCGKMFAPAEKPRDSRPQARLPGRRPRTSAARTAAATES